MYAIDTSNHKINDKKVDTFLRTVLDGDTHLEVEAGTTGFTGACCRDAGSRTYLALLCRKGDFFFGPIKDDEGRVVGIRIACCGDDGLNAIMKSLAFAYLLSSLSASPVIGLLGCVFCGFSVGIMWPGTISLTSPRIPQGGTALFAMLAMAGDLGGAFGPSLVGSVTQKAGDNLQAGMLAGSVFPLILVISLFLIRRQVKPACD